MIVARIGATALAVGELVADGVVVITLNALNAMIVQQGKHAIGVWTEGAHVAETINCIDAALLRVLQCSFQCEVIVVNAAENRDAIHAYFFARSTSSLIVFLRGSTVTYKSVVSCFSYFGSTTGGLGISGLAPRGRMISTRCLPT